MNSFDMTSFCVGVAAGVGVLGLLWVFYMFCQPYLKAFFSDAHIGFADIIGMRLRRTPVHLIIDAYIAIRKRSLRVPIDKLEAIYLAYRFEIHDCLDLVDLVERQLRVEMERASQSQSATQAPVN